MRSKALVHKFLGHADFVKAVACVTLSTTSDSQLSGNSGSSDKSQSGTLQLLASGSADGAIIVWNAATEEILQKLRGHARGVQDLLVWPSTTPAPITTTTTTTIITAAAAAAGEPERAAALSSSSAVLLSAGSEREIKRWLLEYEPVSKTVRGRLLGEALLFHETSVYRMRLSGPRGPDEQDQDQDQNQDAEQEADVGAGGGWELYTASADKSVAVIRGMGPLRGEGRVSRRLDHPDFVRDVLLAVRDDDYYPGHMQFVVTACRDEDIRVWNNPGEVSSSSSSSSSDAWFVSSWGTGELI